MSTIQAAAEQTGIPAAIKRNTVLLAIAQMAGWLAIQMLSTLGSIVAFRLTADERWAGIPLTLATLSAALVAPRAGRLMDSAGRRPVLQAGQAALALGSLIMGASVFFGSMGGFLAGTLLWGAGTGITALSRSAAA